jgi:inosose dehydratase
MRLSTTPIMGSTMDSPTAIASTGPNRNGDIRPPMLSVGTAPVNWNNDDLPGWAPFVPVETVLDEMAAAGYAGTEFGSGFPLNADALRSALSSRALSLCGAYQWLDLLAKERLCLERSDLGTTLQLLSAAGCEHLIVAATMTSERVALAGHVPIDGSAGLDDRGWSMLVRNLAAIAEQAADYGIRTHYHNHVGTYVETPAEVDRLLEVIGETGADLCFDTGHYAYGGGDPTSFALAHGDRIGYLHLKDVDPATLATSRDESWSFLDALRHCIFCEFGEGMVDIPAIVMSLGGHGFAGWVVVEQDTSRRRSFDNAVTSRRFLRHHCGI